MKERFSWCSRVLFVPIFPNYTKENQTCCTSQLTSTASN